MLARPTFLPRAPGGGDPCSRGGMGREGGRGDDVSRGRRGKVPDYAEPGYERPHQQPPLCGNGAQLLRPRIPEQPSGRLPTPQAMKSAASSVTGPLRSPHTIWWPAIPSETHKGLNRLEALLFSAVLAAMLNVAAAVAEFVVAGAIVIEAGQNVPHSSFCNVVERLYRQECLM